jgi:hypothetical protein
MTIKPCSSHQECPSDQSSKRKMRAFAPFGRVSRHAHRLTRSGEELNSRM